MLTDYQTLVEKLIRDDSGVIAVSDMDTAILLAVHRYSTDRPRVIVEDVAPSGTQVLTPPSLWDVDFSRIVDIEYPLSDGRPIYLDSDQYYEYYAPTGRQIRFDLVPVSALRVRYSIAHALSQTQDTLPILHREAVASLAASLCCEQLSSWYANAGDETIQADRVNRLSQSKDYAARAASLRQRYLDGIGVEDKKVSAAGEVVNLNLKNSVDQDRLTHPNRFR